MTYTSFSARIARYFAVAGLVLIALLIGSAATRNTATASTPTPAAAVAPVTTVVTETVETTKYRTKHVADPAVTVTVTAEAPATTDDLTDAKNAIFTEYGKEGVSVFCTGDYTGSAAQHAALGDEDSAAVDEIFSARESLGYEPQTDIC